jgi:amidohydrolase
MLDKVKKYEDYIIRTRRKLHENPELSCQEFNTKKLILEELKKLNFEIKEIEDGTSIIATLKGGKPGKTIALRADFDALPIIEQSDVEFISKNHGVMHACGHDAHTSMLLGAANVLAEMRDEIKGEIRFFFQEGEEIFAGAKKIIAAGGMEGVDACFGMHGMPIPTGTVNIESGYRLSGCDTIYVKFEGVSGHGSAPHLAKDTVHPACLFVTDIQSIITKNINPQEAVVVSAGKINGGTKANIVSKYTEVDLSMRYFNPEARKTVHDAIIRHAKAIAEAYEIKVDVNIEESTPSLNNNESMVNLANEVAKKIMGENCSIPMQRPMASDDMAFYFQRAKGVYAFIGYKNEEKGSIYFPHHEKFKLDEDYFKYGAAMFVQFALDYLNGERV